MGLSTNGKPITPWQGSWAELLQRASREDLADFDSNSKQCTMNCGPALGDPRSEKERRFLCTDCETMEK